MMVIIIFLVFKKTAQQPLMRLKELGEKKKENRGRGLKWHIRGNYLGGLSSSETERLFLE